MASAYTPPLGKLRIHGLGLHLPLGRRQRELNPLPRPGRYHIRKLYLPAAKTNGIDNFPPGLDPICKWRFAFCGAAFLGPMPPMGVLVIASRVLLQLWAYRIAFGAPNR